MRERGGAAGKFWAVDGVGMIQGAGGSLGEKRAGGLTVCARADLSGQDSGIRSGLSVSRLSVGGTIYCSQQSCDRQLAMPAFSSFLARSCFLYSCILWKPLGWPRAQECPPSLLAAMAYDRPSHDGLGLTRPPGRPLPCSRQNKTFCGVPAGCRQNKMPPAILGHGARATPTTCRRRRRASHCKATSVSKRTQCST